MTSRVYEDCGDGTFRKYCNKERTEFVRYKDGREKRFEKGKSGGWVISKTNANANTNVNVKQSLPPQPPPLSQQPPTTHITYTPDAWLQPPPPPPLTKQQPLPQQTGPVSTSGMLSAPAWQLSASASASSETAAASQPPQTCQIQYLMHKLACHEAIFKSMGFVRETTALVAVNSPQPPPTTTTQAPCSMDVDKLI